MCKFSEILKELRVSNKISQQYIADKLNVDRSLISQWERNVCEPNLESLQKLCVILDISADELIGTQTEEQRNTILNNIKN